MRKMHEMERVGDNGRFHTGSASHYSCPGTKTMGTDREKHRFEALREKVLMPEFHLWVMEV